MDYLINMSVTLGLLFFAAMLLVVSFYTSFLLVPFLLLSIAGIGIYNYLKVRD